MLGTAVAALAPSAGSSPPPLPQTGLISEWRFAEGSGTTVADSVGANPINLTLPTNPNTTWTSRGITSALGLVQTPSIANSRTVCMLYRVGRDEAAGFMYSGGTASGAGMIADSVSQTYGFNIGCGGGVSPLIFRALNGTGAYRINRGGWMLAFIDFGSALTSAHGFGGRHSTTTSRCTDFEIAWAAVYSGALTSQNRADIYDHVRGTFAKPRSIYIDWRDCPTDADTIMLIGESNSDGRALISELSAPDQARTITKTRIGIKTLGSRVYPPAVMVVGVNQTTSVPSGQFGPETPIAWARQDAATTRQLWIAKSAVGSSFLAASGLGSSTPNFSWNETEVETSGLFNQGNLYNWWDVEQYMLMQGVGPKLIGVLYDLGLNDATATTQTVSAVAYQAEMQAFYDALKIQVAQTALPIVVARTHNHDPASNATALGHVRTAQAAFQAANSTVCTLIDTDAYTRNADNVHYNAAGIKVLGAAYYAALFGPSSALSLNFTTGTLDPRITFSRTSLATIFDSTGKLNYPSNNLQPQTADLTNVTVWVPGATSITLSAGAGPSGVDAWTLTEDGANTQHNFTAVNGQAGASVAGYNYNFSCYFQASSRSLVRIIINNFNTFTVYLDLSAISTYSQSGGTSPTVSIVDAGGGWRRFSVTDVATTTAQFRPTINIVNTGTTVSYTGNSSAAILLASYQHEAVTYETAARTYVATTAVAYHGPRFDYTQAPLATPTLMIEEARSNLCLRSRDLANASWTATNVTAARTQTGLDGVANTASSITSTAGNGTVLQTITSGSAVRFMTAWVKRLTGTGTIEMTLDNGATWTAVTVTGSWSRVSIPSQTFTNPIVGFRIVTSGDSIAVDLVQLENGAFATSEMVTYAATFSRTLDTPTMTGTNFSNWYNASAGTFIVEFNGPADGTRSIVSADDNTANEQIRLYGSGTDPKFTVTDGGATQADLDAGTIAANTYYKIAGAFAANDFAACIAGGTVQTDVAGTLPTPTQLRIGSNQATNPLCGRIKSITFYASRLPDVTLQALTA